MSHLTYAFPADARETARRRTAETIRKVEEQADNLSKIALAGASILDTLAGLRRELEGIESERQREKEAHRAAEQKACDERNAQRDELAALRLDLAGVTGERDRLRAELAKVRGALGALGVAEPAPPPPRPSVSEVYGYPAGVRPGASSSGPRRL